MDGETDSASNLVFGPWMSAVRQRRPAAAPVPKAPVKASSSCSVPQSATVDPCPEAGWVTPLKVSRRSPPGSSKVAQVLPASGGGKEGSAPEALLKASVKGKKKLVSLIGEKEAPVPRAVPVDQARAVFKESGRDNLKLLKAGLSESQVSNSLISINPFASLSLASNEGGQFESRDIFSGPLKRPRPADSLPPRSNSNLERRKGKSKGNKLKCRVDTVPCSASSIEPFGCPGLSGQGVVMANLNSSMIQDGQGLEIIEVDPEAQQACPMQNSEGDPPSTGCQIDSFMSEDQGGVHLPPVN